MSDALPRTSLLPADREAWQQKRDARQILLAKVRARRRMMLARAVVQAKRQSGTA